MLADSERRALGRRLLELIDGARKGLLLYPSSHPKVRASFIDLEATLARLLAERPEVTLAVLDHEFYLDELPLKRESTSFRKLAKHLVARRATRISFSTGITPDELRELLGKLESSPEELAGLADSLSIAAVPFPAEPGQGIDTCGTGGDGQSTFNISTTAALVAADYLTSAPSTEGAGANQFTFANGVIVRGADCN